MPDTPLMAHSMLEAYLYLMATPCASCGEGPLEGAEARFLDDDDRTVFSIDTSCGACGALTAVTFQLSGRPAADNGVRQTVVNPTDEPSHIVDVAQWITLAHVILEDAQRETDRVRARNLNLKAAQCLEEALKFYDDADNDLPPPEAFLLDASRRGFRENPEEFSKRRLIGLKSKLPSPSPSESGIRSAGRPGQGRRWRKRQ